MSFFGNIIGGLSDALQVAGAVITNPITALTQGINPAINKFNSATAAEDLTKTLVNVGTLGLAATGVGLAIDAGLGVTASTIGSAIIHNPIKSAVAAVAIPAVFSSQSLQQGVENAPISVTNFGSNIGKFIDNPSIPLFTNIVKENPVLSATAAGVGLAGLGYGGSAVANLVSNYQNTQAVKANTAATQNSINPVQQSNLPQQLSPQQVQSPAVAAPTSSEAPAGQKKKTTKKKRKKKKSKKKTRRSKKKHKKSHKKSIKRRKHKR